MNNHATFYVFSEPLISSRQTLPKLPISVCPPFTLEILTTKANNFFQVLKMNEKSRNPLEKRSSSTRAKKVDYAALQEIKIEEVDCDDDFDDTGIVFQDKAEK